MVVGGGYTAFGGSTEGGEDIAEWAFAVCLAIRRGGRFLFRSMSTATAAAGTRLGTIASARLSRVGANIVRHGSSHRLGE